MADAVDRDAASSEFDSNVDVLLQRTCEVACVLVGAHQTAMSFIVAG